MGVIYSINTISTGYRLVSGETLEQTIYGKPWRVINQCPHDVFMPTRTEAEFNQFKQNAPACIVPISCSWTGFSSSLLDNQQTCCPSGLSLIGYETTSSSANLHCCDMPPTCSVHRTTLSENGQACCPGGRFIAGYYLDSPTSMSMSYVCCSY